MGFLDNSGDIILDVVLTDHGRKELSKGDGSFKITKFALGDEEIDYSLYDHTHSSGSSYYDLEILQTPILEAFTDNAASMKSKLVTYENLDLLFLPIMKLSEIDRKNERYTDPNTFVVAVDRFTEGTVDGVAAENGIGFNGANVRQGIIFGESIQNGDGTTIKVDQGLDTTQISYLNPIPADMMETGFVIQIDSRFGSIVDPQGNELKLDEKEGTGYIDDDGIAYYTVLSSDNTTAITQIPTDSQGASVIAGPRGVRLEFKIKASLDLQTSSFLFERLGGTDSTKFFDKSGAATDVLYIDSIIRVSGMNSGYSLDLPVRFVKLQS
jgi:hypothetical protein